MSAAAGPPPRDFAVARLRPSPLETNDVDGRATDRVATVLFALFWLGWFGMLIASTGRFPGFIHGDRFSDANVWIAGRFFDNYGWARSAGMPVQYTYLPAGEAPKTYTHYPPGPEWLHQAWKALGARELWQFRLISLGAAALGTLLAAWAFSLLTGRRWLGLLAAFFYMCAPAFAGFSDSQHQHTYMQATFFAFLVAWLKYEQAASPGARRAWLGAAVLTAFVDGWLTFEHIPMLAIFVVVRTFCLRRRVLLVGMCVALATPLVVVGTRLAHNVVALGGVQPAINDLVEAAVYRTGAHERVTLSDVQRVWWRRLGFGEAPPDAFDREFVYPVLAPAVVVLTIALLGFAVGSQGQPGMSPANRGLLNAALLAIAGGVWMAALRNHAMIHRHLVLLVMPGLALWLASLVAAGLAACLPPLRLRGTRAWVGAGLGLGMIAAWLHAVYDAVSIYRVAPLSPVAESVFAQRIAGERRIASVNAALSGVSNLVIAGMYPEMVQALSVPFEYTSLRSRRRAEPGAGPSAPHPAPPSDAPAAGGVDADERARRELYCDDLAPSEALWVEAYSPLQKRSAVWALRLYGFPDFVAPDASSTLIFRGRPPAALDLDVAVGPDLRLTGLRWSAALDGRTVVAQARFAGAFDAEALSRLVLVGRLRDATGRELASKESRFEWGAAEADAALVWVAFDAAVARAAASLDLALWDGRDNRQRVFDAGGRLRPGLSLDAARTTLSWRLTPLPEAAATPVAAEASHGR